MYTVTTCHYIANDYNIEWYKEYNSSLVYIRGGSRSDKGREAQISLLVTGIGIVIVTVVGANNHLWIVSHY